MSEPKSRSSDRRPVLRRPGESGSPSPCSFQSADVLDTRTAILICTRDRAASLRATFKSLSGVRVPLDWSRPELLVVDNGSVDDTAAVVASAATSLRHMDVRYVHQPAGGKSAGLNRALADSAGPAVLFSDDDVRFPPDWVERMAGPIVTGGADAVAGGVRLAPALVRDWMTPMQRSWLADTALLRPERGELVGANMAVARHALTAVGGFDEKLGPGALGFRDDSTLGWLLHRRSCRIVDRRAVEVEHHFAADRLTRTAFLAMAVKHGRSTAYFMRRYQHFRRRWAAARLAKCHARRLADTAWHRRSGDDPPTDPELALAVEASFWAEYARADRSTPSPAVGTVAA